MAKTDWQMNDIIQPVDLNQIGQEINAAASVAAAAQVTAENHAARHAAGGPDEITPEMIGAETPNGAQTKASQAEANAKTYADGKFLPASQYTANDVLNKLKTIDGAGSGLDADLLDGKHASDFLLASAKAADADKLDGVDGANYVRRDVNQTMAAILTAQNNTSYTTRQVRNITLSTANPSGGGNGDIWIKYAP
jgi:hypothetical protein